jgi:hypothetical protein
VIQVAPDYVLSSDLCTVATCSSHYLPFNRLFLDWTINRVGRSLIFSLVLRSLSLRCRITVFRDVRACWIPSRWGFALIFHGIVLIWPLFAGGRGLWTPHRPFNSSDHVDESWKILRWSCKLFYFYFIGHPRNEFRIFFFLPNGSMSFLLGIVIILSGNVATIFEYFLPLDMWGIQIPEQLLILF